MAAQVIHCVFVYGTLRRGFESHALIRRLGGQYVGRGSVAGELYDLGPFPGAIRSRNGAGRVVGEVYRFKNLEHALPALDEYEGVWQEAPERGRYYRQVSEVTFEHGGRVEAWVYWLRRRPEARIASDYAKR